MLRLTLAMQSYLSHQTWYCQNHSQLANKPNKLDKSAHLAIVLLVEESVCMLRYGRARHHHLHDLPILAALFTQVLYDLQVITTTPHTHRQNQNPNRNR